MFTTHFQMTRHPFSEHTSVDSLLRDERVSQGLARLNYLLQHGAIGLVIGATGVGKSSLIKLFLSQLSSNHVHPAYLHLTRLSSTSFLKLVVTALGETPRYTRERVFLQILEKTRSLEMPVLLVVDEAHLLSAGAFTDLRLLVSNALDEAPPLKILLCGQEPLREPLKRTCHADLVHRISVRYHIPPMDRDQTAAYVDFQIKQAGGDQKIFEPEVKSLLYDHTRGIPRQINNLATACLIHAAVQNAQRINEAIFQATLAEFQLP